MGLLEGSKLVITGVLNDASLAFGTARLAQLEGAELVLTGFGRGLSLTARAARKLPVEADVLELDITNPEHLGGLAEELARRWGKVDGALHSIAYAPESCLGGNFLNSEWEDVAVALQTSAYSFKSLATALHPLMREGGGSLVGLTFDASVSWPLYDWMGVAKAALESTSRYLARHLGPDRIRVNLVAAGPMKTVAARSIPGYVAFEEAWNDRTPLGWDVSDLEPVSRACVALLSDWFPATTGEILHVDGGFHAMGI